MRNVRIEPLGRAPLKLSFTIAAYRLLMSGKFGRDPTWEGHLATEIGQAEVAVDALLYEARLPLRQMMALDVGDTPMLELRSDALVIVGCGGLTLTEGRMGRVGAGVALRVAKPLRKPG
jgi:flagellar motor switch protein FliM